MIWQDIFRTRPDRSGTVIADDPQFFISRSEAMTWLLGDPAH